MITFETTNNLRRKLIICSKTKAIEREIKNIIRKYEKESCHKNCQKIIVRISFFN